MGWQIIRIQVHSGSGNGNVGAVGLALLHWLSRAGPVKPALFVILNYKKLADVCRMIMM